MPKEPTKVREGFVIPGRLAVVLESCSRRSIQLSGRLKPPTDQLQPGSVASGPLQHPGNTRLCHAEIQHSASRYEYMQPHEETC